ncbi:MAG: CocE/NonD family hydrolase, partial [Planctomycetaceae bacterium]|nr:CocE/NonD family hydrolase [Planctomycetaceae bacterium]
MHLPISETDQKIGWSIPWLKAIFMHPEPNGYWDRLNLTDRITELQMPIQHMVGYYDFFSRESVGNFVQMREHASNPAIRQQQQLILGPWDHGTIGKSQVGEVDFGPEARLDTVATSIAWYDQYLKPAPPAGAKPPVPVRYFVMGENTWREAQSWPPSGFTPASFYLGSAGKANTRSGDGRLERSPPLQAKPSDTFRADPAQPTPAC